MKAVGKMKHMAIAMIAVLCFAVLSVGVVCTTAHAAEEKIFGYGDLANRTYLTGVTQADMEAAFEEEGTRLKTAMTEAGQGDLFTIVNAPLGNGWDAAFINAWVACHMDLGAYSGWNNWGRNGYAFIVYNPHTKKAYTVRGNAAAAYTNSANGWTNQVIHAGYPKGNDFTVTTDEETVVCQNFTLGYARGAQFEYGKNIGTDGTEITLTANDIAESMFVPVWVAAGTETAAFTASAVTDYVNAYKAYYTGKEVNTGAMSFAPRHKISEWYQIVSDANGDKIGEVVYNASRKEMFTVLDTFGNSYLDTWGSPIGEQTTIHGVVNQLFTAGVAVVEKDSGQNDVVNFYAASHVDPETGEIVAALGANDVGAVGSITLPTGITEAAVKTAAQAKYTAALGTPTDYMQYAANSTKVLEQTFIASDNSTSKIYVDTSASPVKATLLAADAYALYAKPTRFNEGNKVYDVTGEMVLGFAKDDAFTVGDKKYQNFELGAVEITAAEGKEVMPGVNYNADGTRTLLDLNKYISIKSDLAIPPSFDISPADLLEKFRTAYTEYVAQGIALGMPNKEGIGLWIPDAGAGGGYTEEGEFIDGRGMIKMGLHMTDSDAICYYGVTAMLAYNPEDGKVYIMKDAVISNMATYYCVYGAPRGNLTKTTLTVDDEDVEVEIQNFQLGYLTVMNGSASMIADKNWDFALRGAVNLDGSKIPGTVYPGENEQKPDNDTPKKSDKGCKGEFTTSESVFAAIAAGAVLLAAAVLVTARKRKEN